MTLLIVEDNARMRQLIRNVIGDLAERIHECDDGDGVLEAYEECSPDWVLMDIRMPELDGINATRELKRVYPEARIMIVTDYDDAQLREAACEAGASAYVTKENLLEIRKILDKMIVQASGLT